MNFLCTALKKFYLLTLTKLVFVAIIIVIFQEDPTCKDKLVFFIPVTGIKNENIEVYALNCAAVVLVFFFKCLLFI